MTAGSRLRSRLQQLLLLCLAAVPFPPAAAASFEAAALESSEGYFQIRWEADEPVRLVEASSPDFAGARTLYTGTDQARVVSGKPDGTWYYRLESAASGRALGEPLVATVRHHPLGRAVFFFVIGAVVFAATFGLIVFAGRATHELGE